MSNQIVIVGGGGAGIDLAQELLTKLASKEYTITLITDKDYYPHYISALRSISGPSGDTEWPESTILPLDRLFQNDKNVKLVIAKGTSIEYEGGAGSGKGNVITDKGDRIPFDVLAVTTGSTWEAPLDFPSTKKEALQYIYDWQEKIKNAEGVAIVGGGPVGIELAGEIRDQYPTKPITIVHNKPLLISETYPDKFRRDLASRLVQKDVQLILDDSVDVENIAGNQIITATGSRVKADLLIPTRGPKANSALLESLTPRPITNLGHADVEATLQLQGYSRIFALGDVINWEGEVAQKSKHRGHVPVASDNIVDVLAGREPQAKYKKTFEAIFITIGKASFFS